MSWIDVHTHLEMLKAEPAETIAQAQEAGVQRMITIACHPDEIDRVFSIAKAHYPTVCCTIGVHPHEAKLYTDEIGEKMRQLSQEPCVVGLGEMGLDYYYNQSPKDAQLDAFEKQMALAADLGLPVQIHTRDAEEDTFKILKRFHDQVKGILHCFTGTQWMADEALKLGYNISFSGIVTFKNAKELQAVAQSVPLDRIHVETDAPFLAPVPMRGKENVPAYTAHTAKFLADLRGISEDELSKSTLENTLNMFSKMRLK